MQHISILRIKSITLFAALSITLYGNQFALPSFQAVHNPQSQCTDCALYFDGPGSSDHVSIDAGQNGGSHTFEVWVKRIDSGHNNALLLQSDNYGIKIEQFNQSNKVGFTRYGSYDHQFNHSATIAEWEHIAIVNNGSKTYLYVNGTVTDSTNRTNWKLPMNSIGVGGNATLYGTIDEMRIWNDARTAAEIADNMELELNGDEDDLIAYYKMSNGSGTTLTDNSTNSYTGTLTNMNNSAWVTSYAPIANMNASYKTDVEAVWQNTGTDDSSPSNGLYMTMGSALTEQNWAVFGNNNTSGSTTSDLPSGVGLRSGRIWQVAERGTVAPNITIAMSDATGLSTFAHSATANKLLSRSGSSGNFAILTQGSSTSRSNKTVQFNSVSLDSGYYYALGIASSLLSDGSWGSTSWLKAQDFDGVQDRAYQSAGTSATENPLHRSTNGDGKAWTVSALFNYNDSNGWPIWHQGAYQDGHIRLIANNSSGILFKYGDEGNAQQLTFTNSSVAAYSTWYSISVSFDGGTTGYSNYALEFDGGDDRVSLPNSVNMGTSDFTISIRFKTDAIGSGRQQVFQQTGGNANRVIAINNDGVIASQLGSTSSESGFTASANTWYHVVLVHDDSENTLKWYVDGTAKNTNTSVNIGSNTGIFKLGTNSGSSDKWFDGQMDELRIWSAALAEAQIPGDSGTDSILIGNESNLVAYYRFDKYDGTTIEDLTSNNYHGTTQQMTGDHRTASGVTLAPLDSLDDYYGRFKFYTTNLSTGAVSSFSMSTSNNNYGYTGAVDGQFYVGARGGNSYCLRGQFAYIGVTNSALSSSTIQGNGSYQTGFALDPVGWANGNFTLPDATASNTTKIWLFGDGASDDANNIYNYINPSDNDSRLITVGDRREIAVIIAN